MSDVLKEDKETPGNLRPGHYVATRMLTRALLLTTAIACMLIVAPAALGDSGTYVDDDRSRYEGFIETASEEGIVTGCNPPANDRFCPHAPVTRSQLAVMLARGLGLPPTDDDYFSDDDGHVGEDAINALAAAGITRGCMPDRYCPDRPLSRGETAELISRALGWDRDDLDDGRYVDLGRSAFAASMLGLARRGGMDPCDPPEGRRLCPEGLVTRDEAVFALVTALGLSPVRRQEQPPGPSVGFMDRFENLDLWDGRSPGSRNRVSLTDNGFRDQGLRVRIPRGSHYGADFRLELSEAVGEDPERLFFRYYLRLDPDWAPEASGKLPGFSGVYGSSGKGGYRSNPSSPGWSARMQFFGTRPDDHRARLGFYVYHLGQERRYGDGMMWNEAGKLQPGDWYCIEGEVELNAPGIPDGALRAWVDGTPAFEAAGIEFRRPDEPEIRIESFWFNVYYGGKPVANTNLGLTVDEVAVDGQRIGCAAGGGLGRRATGDLTGNGFDERVWWGACRVGSCFQLQRTTERGRTTPVSLGDGAWFSLETHRYGIHLADFDGDGHEDVIYRGRCDQSVSCWRVHRGSGSSLGPGENWGDRARLEGSHLVVGDWDGDGRADVAYRGRCGNDAARCWRVHRSTGDEFAHPEGWGEPPSSITGPPTAADITGDGHDDIVYAAPCDEEECWFVQTSDGSSFSPPQNLGVARPEEVERMWLADGNSDGGADLLTVRPSAEDGSRIEMRIIGEDGLGEPQSLLLTASPVEDLLMRRRSSDDLLEALVLTACDDGRVCTERLLTLSGRLIPPEDYARMLTEELIRLLVAERDPHRITIE